MKIGATTMCALALCAWVGCSRPTEEPTSTTASASSTGAAPDGKGIAVDGSSTVFPVTRAIAERYNERSTTKASVEFSGTGGGFRKFCRGEIVINGASRPITAAEVDACRKAGIRFIELPLALDGIAVVVNPRNDWATSLTVAELKRLWEPAAEGKLERWSQLRPGFPDREIHLYGAGSDSGTYDYFTAAIVGVEHSSRSDYTSSEDDDAIVEEVAADADGLGFFGYAYYAKNRSRLKLVAIDDEKASNGSGPVLPSLDTIAGGSYQPLTRPMFIYVDSRATERPEAAEFVRFILREARSVVKETGYMPLSPRGYELAQARFEHRVKGSLFHGAGSTIGVTASDLSAGQ